MKFPWIENYAGRWVDSEGRKLIITTHDDENATVDLLIHGNPMIRPWCGNAPAEGLSARYNPVEGPDLDVELGKPGFSLNLNYEFDGPITLEGVESLSVGVSCYQSDTEAKQFTKLFGKLGRYRRVDT